MVERSSTDLLSNKTILRGYSQAREIALVGLGIYPEQTLPQFLHELTHHWCFNSPVGLAVALLQLEAAAIVVRGERRPAFRERARDCLVKAAVATSLLWPLAEGMALFAEFDLMVTGHGELVSAPVALIAHLFRKRIAEAEHQVGLPRSEGKSGEVLPRVPTALDAPFLALRTSPHLIDRKSSLLSSEFTIDGDAYLLGYLIIKSTWVRSFTRFWRMFDTDLFQVLFRSFVFGESALVSMLLDPSPCSQLTVGELARHIERRLFEFQQSPVEPFATQLEEQNRNAQFGRVGPLLELERVPWEAEALRQAASDAVSSSLERLAQQASDGSGRMFIELAESLVSQRLAMNVLSVDAGFERNSEGLLVVTHGGTPVHVMDARGHELPNRGTGRFSVHVVPTTALQFCVFEMSEPRLLFYDVLSEGATEAEGHALDMEMICRAVTANDGMLQVCRMAMEKAEADSGIDWVKSKQSLRQAALPAYSLLALSFAKDRAAVQAKMQQAGFWTLLDGDTSAVEQLARLSCWSSLCLSLEIQDQLCRSHGFTLAEASERLLRYCNAVGFQFFALGRDGRPISLG